MTTNRELSEDEIDWLQEHSLGGSHEATGSENLAACHDCDWVAQGDSFDYLMEQVTTHLVETFKELSVADKVVRRREFTQEFGWNPWSAGVLTDDDEELESQVFDELEVSELDEEGEVIDENIYVKDLGTPAEYLRDVIKELGLSPDGW